MRIGIDLDNTLICYDNIFHASAISSDLIPEDWIGNKEQLRDYIRLLHDGEHKWQQLQGYVYAEAVKDAESFPGAIRFLWRAKQKGHQLFIVSHKTKFSHHDASKSLRVPARKWLKEKEIFTELPSSLVNDVYFLSTQKEKIEKFNELNLDVLIDDLIEVIENPLLDNDIKAIHFGGERFSSWTGIDNHLLGSLDDSDCFQLIKQSSLGEPLSCQPYKGGGNSSVWKVDIKNSVPLTMKYYHNDLIHHDRRVIENRSLKIMNHYGIENIPKVVLTDKSIEVSIFEHIDANIVNELTETKINLVNDFIGKLNLIKENIKENFPLASAACLSGADILNQISSRLLSFQTACLENPELNQFISKEFTPLFETLDGWAKDNWPNKDNFDKPLEFKKQMLTPSDLGVHNMLEDLDGNVYFIDFEYFGFDDPVKTTSDFLWHPKNKINLKLGRYWVMLMTNTFAKVDSSFSQRLAISWPLYGLCWCLIMLNEYRKTDWQRRIQSKGYSQQEYSDVKLEQLQKAKDLLGFIKLNYQEFPYRN